MSRENQILKKVFNDIKKETAQAVVQSLNRAGASAKTEVSSEIRQNYTMKKKDLDKGLRLHKANKRKMVVSLIATSKPIPLAKFKHTKKKIKNSLGRKAQQVTVEKRIGKRIVLKKAFKASMGSGHTGIFIRKGKDRLPIVELTGPNAYNLAKTNWIEEKAKNKFNEQFEKELGRNLKHYLGK